MSAGGMVIVGAGECGTRAAFALREEGYVGPVTLVGAERHLPYERPPLSKEALASEAADPKFIADLARFEAAAIRLVLSRAVVSIDRRANTIVLDDKTTIPYERLLLATGARPRKPPFAEEARNALYLRTRDDAVTLAGHLRSGAHIAIVGGGFIGLELAAAARRRGCTVTVLEAAPRLMARAVPGEMAAAIEEAHRDNGVDIRCDASIVSIADAGNGVELCLGDGSILTADACVIGVGAVPNVELAQQSGLAIANGILVDTALCTTDPSIFAAGDCCSFPLSIYNGRRVRLEAWRNAQEQGTLAAGNMLGRHVEHAAVPWFWSDQYDLTLQVAGLPDEGTSIVRRDIGERAFLLFHLASDGRLVAASGLGPGNAVARDVRLAEMLIARRAAPPAASLAATDIKLKSMLAA